MKCPVQFLVKFNTVNRARETPPTHALSPPSAPRGKHYIEPTHRPEWHRNRRRFRYRFQGVTEGPERDPINVFQPRHFTAYFEPHLTANFTPCEPLAGDIDGPFASPSSCPPKHRTDT